MTSAALLAALVALCLTAAQGDTATSPASRGVASPLRGGPNCKCQRPEDCRPGIQKVRCLLQWVVCGCSEGYCGGAGGCKPGLSCDTKLNRCFRTPSQLGDPCTPPQHPCGAPLVCSSQTGVCKSPAGVATPQQPVALDKVMAAESKELPAGRSLGQEWATCQTSADCAGGMVCDSCPGGADTRRCRQGAVTKLLASDYLRPYNKIPWLVSHNAYSTNAYSSFPFLLPFTNQDITVPEQLDRGVRGLMLDVYLYSGQVFLCHSKCEFGRIPLGAVLGELKAWLDANPTEVVTIFFEDYVADPAPGKLANEFKSAGLSSYLVDKQSMRSDGSDWLPLRELAKKGRLVVMSDSPRGDFPYQWDYYVESWYGDKGMATSSCPQRDNGSKAMDSKAVGLVLVNWFPTSGSAARTCATNTQANLRGKLAACFKEAGNRWANFVAVDFFEHHDEGGVFKAMDFLNDQWRALYP